MYGFDTVRNVWTTLPSLPEALGGCGAVVFHNKLHVMGGGAWATEFISDVTSHYELDLANINAGWVSRANISIGRNHLAVTTGTDNRCVPFCS